MATIIVEDGSGIPGANAFETVAQTTARLTDRELWSFSGSRRKEGALIEGTQAVMTRIKRRVTGTPRTTTQGLAVPRVGFYVDGEIFPASEIPDDLVQASAFMAEYYAAATEPCRSGSDRDRDLVKSLADPHVRAILEGRP